MSDPYIEVQHHLPITRYARIMGMDVAHLLGVGGMTYQAYASTGTCSRCWTELMREQLCLAIATAEDMIADALGTPVAPTYYEEDLRFPRPHTTWSPVYATGYRDQFGRIGRDCSGWPLLKASWTPIQTLGTITLTALEGYTFEWQCDADGVRLAGQLIIPDATAAVNMSRLRIFYEGDGSYFLETGEVYEYRGLKIQRIGDNIVVTGERAQWVKPDACLRSECVDWGDDDEFVATEAELGVYEETDHIENAVCYIWSVDEDGYTCAEETQRACPGVTDRDLGYIQAFPASWDPDAETLTQSTPTNCWPPDRVILRYRAGQINPHRRPHHYATSQRNVDQLGANVAMAIARLANSFLPEKIRCSCDPASTQWREDKRFLGFGGTDGSRAHNRPVLNEMQRCNFPPTYGAYHAWLLLKPRLARVGGIVG